MKPANTKTFKFKAFIVLATLLSALAALELAARMLVPKSIFNPRLSSSDTNFRVFDGETLWSMPGNTHYTPGGIASLKSARGTFLIVGLGDSIMNGLNIPADKTYMSGLSASLAGRGSPGAAILDLSMPGFNFVQESAAYREIATGLSPDLVIVHSWEDDAAIYKIVGGVVFDAPAGAGAAPSPSLPPLIAEPLTRHSRLYQIALLQYLRYYYSKQKQLSQNSEIIAAADKLRRACGNNTKILFLFSPRLGDGPVRPALAGLQHKSVYSTLLAWARQNGADILDLGAALNGIDGKSISIDRVHFNAKGHALVRGILADYISNKYIKGK